MGRQIVHRLLISFPALLGVLFLCFCLLQVVPADPAMIIAGPDAKAETIAAIRLELGLDRPIPVQFAEYIGRVLQGDLGRSIISNKMVSEELALTIGPTVELMMGGMLMALAMLIITHDLGVIAEIADEVVVMYAGKIVESAPVASLFADPQHPYTIGLLGSIPRIEVDRERLSTIEGSVPSPNNQPKGCRFAPRCPFADPRCHLEPPPLRDLGPEHRVACWKAPVELARAA